MLITIEDQNWFEPLGHAASLSAFFWMKDFIALSIVFLQWAWDFVRMTRLLSDWFENQLWKALFFWVTASEQDLLNQGLESCFPVTRLKGTYCSMPIWITSENAEAHSVAFLFLKLVILHVYLLYIYWIHIFSWNYFPKTFSFRKINSDTVVSHINQPRRSSRTMNVYSVPELDFILAQELLCNL